MRNNITYIKISFVLITIFLLIPIKTFAYPYNSVISNSSCAGITKGTGKDGAIDIGITGEKCINDETETQGAGGGMYLCAQEELGIWTDYFHEKPGQTGKTKTTYYYVPFRIDAWSNDNGDWTIQSGLGIATCPDMQLSYKTTTTIGDPINNLAGKKNAKIVNISYMDVNNDWFEFGSSTINAFREYRVSPDKISVTSLSNGKSITDSNGKLVENAGEYSVQINISKLTTNGPQGLGYNGTNKFLGSVGNSRAIHYFVPLKITIEYDNETYKPDPCLETVNGISPQLYAYKNRGKCCDAYPETCCLNDDGRINEDILKIKNIRPDVFNFCCSRGDHGYRHGLAYYDVKLPILQTFYNGIDAVGSIYNYCLETCNDIAEYYYDNTANSPSYCCQQYPLKNPNRCKKTENCNTGKCSNDSYFTSNYQCCCDANPDDDRCTYKTWKSSGLSCSNFPTNVDASFGTGTVAEGSSSDGRTKENITFTKYDMLEKMKSNIVKSGMGFDYNISVRHQILKAAPISYDYYSEGYGKTTAIKEAKKEIDKYLLMTADEKNKVTETSSKFIFSTLSPEPDNYVLDSEIELLPDPIKIKKYISICYEDYDNIDDRYEKECDTFEYVAEKIYTYTYDLKLQQKYIAKDDASIATSYGSEEEEINYLDGGTKFYTEVKTNTGIYDFYVKLDESETGVTGNLKNYEDKGFFCQYGVVNEIENNDKFNCGTIENPTPCDEDDGGNPKPSRNFYFRPISLNEPFPNRDPGSNWSGTIKGSSSVTKENQYIKKSSTGNSNGNSVYSNENEDAKYRIKLTPALIRDIKEYNEQQENNVKGYLDWDTMISAAYNNADLISSFWTNAQISWDDNNRDIPEESYRRTKIGDF